MANSYTWTATGSGNWSTVSNWFDVTTGMPAVAAPGPAATAEIDNAGTGTITVTGPADVLNLSVSGDVTLAGNFAIGSFTLAVPPFNPSFVASTLISTIALAGSFGAGSLDIGDLHGVAGFPSVQFADYGLIEVDLGAMLTAGSVAVRSGDLRVDGGAASIGNSLTLGTIFLSEPFVSGGFSMTTGSLEDLNHGSVQLGSLAIADGSVSLDATSTLEIGNAGTAAAGTITVDPGADLEFGVPFNVAAVITESPTLAISSPILNNGHIGTDTDLSHVINNGTIAVTFPAFGTHPTLSFISGNGQIELSSIGEPFTIGSGVSGTLDLDHVNQVIFSLGAGVPIDVSDTPRIANFGFDGTSGTIVLDGISADTATYMPTGTGIGTVTLENGSTEVASLTMLGSYASNAFFVAAGSGDTVLSLNPPCFAAGTRIATPRGEVPVEALRMGDEVTLASGGAAPIVWIGLRRVDCRSHPEPHQVWPVRISRGAFAPGVPRRDLFLSPDHAVFAEGVLIPIKHLLNDESIRQVARDTVTYFHLELPAHDVVLADGLPVESYLDTGGRISFENAGRVVALFPAFSSLAWEAYGYAPLVVTGPAVDAARRRIETRARAHAVAPRRRKRRSLA
jgi:hypothetical protein